ncbi:hypothetical protein K469DRAFT_741017 [Zopfia rhizophila CBS 207.26]|uniref:Uncharacterized protein n=1 Tax=Zopfia rhizophila CBS 207.26 TaxID=1314779 RepID=A0A6A6DMN5_9PEZI|nr:hypothetical protein K469DRAFT_741017 [Zopfia rhizophila CBS 207.26]
MVSTRRGPVGSSTPTSSATQKTPRSTAQRGKRAWDIEGTSAASAKRRKHESPENGEPKEADEGIEAPRETDNLQDAPKPILDTIEVKSISESFGSTGNVSSKEKLPYRRQPSPKVVIRVKSQSPTEPVSADLDAPSENEVPSSTQEAEYYTPKTQIPSSVYATPATTLKAAPGSPTSEPEIYDVDQRTESSTKKTKKGKISAPVMELPDETPSSMWESDQASTSAQESDEEPTPIPASKQEGKKSTTSKFPDEIPSSTFDSEDAILSTQESDKEPTPASESKKGHVRFGSGEPSEHESAQEPAPASVSKQSRSRFVPIQKITDDEESDSDEAPEMVTAATALSKTKAAETAASQAYKALQEKQRLKKKVQAERMAEEQERKRKKEEKKAKKIAKAELREAQYDKGQGKGPKLDIHNLPALLPDSLLEAAGERRPPTPPPATLPGQDAAAKWKEKLNRHIKFLERGEKPIKDVRKGPVNVHVLAKQNSLLPPKANRDTKHVREKWLKGKQAEKRGKNGRKDLEFRKIERRSTGGGFLRGEDR